MVRENQNCSLSRRSNRPLVLDVHAVRRDVPMGLQIGPCFTMARQRGTGCPLRSASSSLFWRRSEVRR